MDYHQQVRESVCTYLITEIQGKCILIAGQSKNVVQFKYS